ncbi:MAG: AAA family ATPase [Planctomycetaceae bacterium]|nr:hypothetical protein [Planctomycetaceae bacterium]
MDLNRKCKDFWGLNPAATPFGKHMEDEGGMFVWPAFEDVVEKIVHVIKHRSFLVMSGEACSCKTAAWSHAKRLLVEESIAPKFSQPMGLNPSKYNESTIYHAIVYSIAPPDGSAQSAFKRTREDRAHQCRQLLEAQNARQVPVVLAVNDAHDCQLAFLKMCKRLWDDLYGFDRLLSVILIGHPSLLAMARSCKEIDERMEIVEMPDLGDSLEDYLAFEFNRCGSESMPITPDGVARLGSIVKRHPLLINNVVSRALFEGFRIKADAIDARLIERAASAERGAEGGAK